MPKRRTVDEDSEIGSNVGGDDDEDDEGEQYEPAPKKKARAGRSAFIDDEVDVEDEEDEEDEDEDDEGGADEFEEDAGAEQVQASEAEAMNRRLDATRRKEEEELLREQVRQRYESADRAQFTHADDEDTSDTRFRDLPDASRDPKLWLMRCKPNHEKMLVISLMQKYLDSMHTDKPLQIKSAMCTDVKGYIYLEAFKEVRHPSPPTHAPRPHGDPPHGDRPPLPVAPSPLPRRG